MRGSPAARVHVGVDGQIGSKLTILAWAHCLRGLLSVQHVIVPTQILQHSQKLQTTCREEAGVAATRHSTCGLQMRDAFMQPY